MFKYDYFHSLPVAAHHQESKEGFEVANVFFFLSTDLLLYKGYRSVLSTTNFSETKFRYTYTCMYISAHTHIHGKLLNMQTRCWVQSVFWSMFRSF